ncbi:MAG: hypothetical protein GQ570_04340 [Helicobacteraceae bacterium]|nr:hypothetical protein [Helicobacteraceae bacterium]
MIKYITASFVAIGIVLSTYGCNSSSNNDLVVAGEALVPTTQKCFKVTAVTPTTLPTNYTAVSVTVQNSCSSSKSLNGLALQLSASSSLAASGSALSYSTSSAPWVKATASISVKNNSDFTAIIKTDSNTSANASNTFTFGYQNSTGSTISGLSVSAKDPLPIGTATINVSVDTTQLNVLCPDSKPCNIGIDIIGSGATLKKNILTITGNTGIQKVSVTKLNSNTYSLSPSSALPESVSYTLSPLSVTVHDNEDENLSLAFIDTSDNKGLINETVKNPEPSIFQQTSTTMLLSNSAKTFAYSFTQEYGSAHTIRNIPSATYTIGTHGLADTASNTFYSMSNKTLTVENNQTTDIGTLTYIKNSSTTKTTFSVSGLSVGDSALISFDDGSYQYNTVTLKDIAAKTLYFIKNSKVTVKVNAGKYYEDFTPFTFSPSSTTTQKIILKKKILPKIVSIDGWPTTHVAQGGVTLMSEGEYTDRPVDSVFYYDNQGSTNFDNVTFPRPTSEVAATCQSKAKNFTGGKCVPTTVLYTANDSAIGPIENIEVGDVTGIGRITDYEHRTSHLLHAGLAAWINGYLIANKSIDAASIILNPDTLGTILKGKQVSKINSTLAANTKTITDSAKVASCFLSSTNFSFNGSEGLTLSEFWSKLSVTTNAYEAQVNKFPKLTLDVYNACLANPVSTNVTVPSFGNTFKGWTQSTNWLLETFANNKNMTYGWQVNLWANGSAVWMHQNYSSAKISSDYSIPVANFLLSAPYSAPYTPDFLIFDKYERDDSDWDAYSKSYFTNNRDWDAILTYVKQIHEKVNNIPIMLWQVPGGHLLTNKYNLPNTAHSSCEPVYFLGDNNLAENLTNINLPYPAITLPSDLSYNCASTGCTMLEYLNMTNYNWANSYKIEEAISSGVFAILWGGGNTVSIGRKPHDDGGWLSRKTMQYYNSTK